MMRAKALLRDVEPCSLSLVLKYCTVSLVDCLLSNALDMEKHLSSYTKRFPVRRELFLALTLTAHANCSIALSDIVL